MQVFEIGCGVAAAFLGKQLQHLGFDVTHVCVAELLQRSDRPCDIVEGPLSDAIGGKTCVRVAAIAELAGNGPLSLADVVVVEGRRAIDSTKTIQSFTSDHAIFAIITPFGLTEPGESEDSIAAEAATGALGTIGFETESTPLGYLFGDINAGIRGAGMVVERLAGMLLGNVEKQAEQIIDISVADCCLEAIENPFQELTFGGRTFHHTGSHRGGMVPYGFFDGVGGELALVIGVGAWNILVDRMEDPELRDEAWSNIETRLYHRDLVIERVADWVRSQDSIDDIVAKIGTDIVAVKVRDFEDIWLHGSAFLSGSVGDGSKRRLVNPYAKISPYAANPPSGYGTPAVTGHDDRSPAPVVWDAGTGGTPQKAPPASMP